jgi:hypothetical protein
VERKVQWFGFDARVFIGPVETSRSELPYSMLSI